MLWIWHGVQEPSAGDPAVGAVVWHWGGAHAQPRCDPVQQVATHMPARARVAPSSAMALCSALMTRGNVVKALTCTLAAHWRLNNTNFMLAGKQCQAGWHNMPQGGGAGMPMIDTTAVGALHAQTGATNGFQHNLAQSTQHTHAVQYSTSHSTPKVQLYISPQTSPTHALKHISNTTTLRA